MKQRAVAIVADYLSYRPIGRVVGLKSIAQMTTTCWRSRTSGTDGSTWPGLQAIWSLGLGRSKPGSACRRRSDSAGGATRSTPTDTSTVRSSATASPVRPTSSRSRWNCATSRRRSELLRPQSVSLTLRCEFGRRIDKEAVRGLVRVPWVM